MKNIYDGLLSFKGEWRTYQQRVLQESDAYMDDGRVHITAAPGAGKTVLGIELIRRTGKPCLILSPRIVIRQQWLERIRGSFFTEKAKTWEENEEQKILSSDIRYPGMITSITYQTLYSAMAGEKNVEESGEGEGTEEINFAGFEFLRQVKKAGIWENNPLQTGESCDRIQQLADRYSDLGTPTLSWYLASRKI